VLLEMYSPEESVFNQSLSAYRLGDYKLIRGTVRDDNYYYESATNRINSSHPSLGSVLVERLIDLCDAVFGKGQCDTINIVIVHVWMPDIIALTDRWLPSAAAQRIPDESSDFRLYNIVRDPCEQTNLAGDPQYASIIAAIDQETASIAAHRRHVLPLDLQLDISLGGAWSKHHVSGDCSDNPAIKPRHCRFTHSWVPDVSSQVPLLLYCYVVLPPLTIASIQEADPMAQAGLMETAVYQHFRAWKAARQLGTAVLGLGAIALLTKHAAKRLFG
jgi:hypothetical protein